MSKERYIESENCEAIVCHCDHFGFADYWMKYRGGDDRAFGVCEECLTLHIMAGCLMEWGPAIHTLSFGDIMAGAKASRKP